MFLAYLLLLICSFLISAFDLVTTKIGLPLFIVATFGLMWELGTLLKRRIFYRRLRREYKLLWIKRGFISNNFSEVLYNSDLAFADGSVIVSSESEYYELPLVDIRSLLIFNGQQINLIDSDDLAIRLGVSSGELVYSHIYNLLNKYRQRRKYTFILISLEYAKQDKYQLGLVSNPLIFCFDCNKHEVDKFLKINCIQSKLHNYLKLLK